MTNAFRKPTEQEVIHIYKEINNEKHPIMTIDNVARLIWFLMGFMMVCHFALHIGDNGLVICLLVIAPITFLFFYAVKKYKHKKLLQKYKRGDFMLCEGKITGAHKESLSQNYKIAFESNDKIYKKEFTDISRVFKKGDLALAVVLLRNKKIYHHNIFHQI